MAATTDLSQTLRITEIFLSLQGESNTVGLLTVFVRLTGCPLRCQYCDTAYAFSGGKLMSLEVIIRQVEEFGVKHVTVTGGEPLAQANVHPLMSELCDREFRVSLETSGALSIAEVDQRVVRVVDLKTPDSKEVHRNLWENLAMLNQQDQIKFVICSRSDYEWAKLKCQEYGLTERVADVFFSPSFDQIAPVDIGNWVVEDRLPVRVQLQLHKLLWGDVPGH
ncbi:MAG: 7-carboxy-7-deazaguanine synthase QueE [Pseudomonadota bacterium]|nr:7-carboxy-7-deazaguanine synthase QueE [Pseudomonadota bacterium]